MKLLRRPALRLLVATSAVLSLMLSSCASGDGSDSSETTPQGAPEGTSGEQVILRYASSSALISFDPRQASPTNPTFLTPVYAALFKQNAEGDVEPDLASEWTMTPDGMQLNLKLRPDVTFHDGEPFNAKAVKANLEEAKKPGYTTTTALANLTKVEVVSELEVNLKFSVPSTDMPVALAGEAGMMISPKALSDANKLKNKPVGAGPFIVTEKVQDRIEYRPWAKYWNKDAILVDGIEIVHIDDDTARLNALTSGQYDFGLIFGAQTKEAEAAGMKTTTGTTASIYALQLNTGVEPFDNPLVRKALQHAIDREAINVGAFDGTAGIATQPFPEGYWAHVPELEDSPETDYDPEKAKALLEEAGMPNGFSFELLAGTNKTYNLAETILQDQLAKVGIKMDINIADSVTVRTARRNGNFQASFASILTGRPSAVTYVEKFYSVDGSDNPGHFAVEGLGDDIIELRSAAEREDMQSAMATIITKVTEAGPPVIPLLTQRPIFAYSPDVTGLEVPINYNYDLTRVSIRK